MTRSAPARSVRGQRGQLSTRPLRRVGHEHLEVGREPPDLLLPVGDQGGRHHEEARAPGIRAASTARRARCRSAPSAAGAGPAPGSSSPAPCRRPGRRPGRGARGTRASGPRSPGRGGAPSGGPRDSPRPAPRACAGAARVVASHSPATTRDQSPPPSGAAAGSPVFDRRPGQEAHRLPEGQARARRAPRLLPVAEDLAELLPVELHPLAPHEGEPVRAGEDRAPLRVGEGLAVERQGDREVEERVQPQGGRRLAADGDADLEPPGPIRASTSRAPGR